MAGLSVGQPRIALLTRPVNFIRLLIYGVPEEPPMQPPTSRLYMCARCRAQVIVCRRRDRDQIDCGRDCSKASLRASLREACRRCQRSWRGRLAHATRMRRIRDRRDKVTYHRSAGPAAGALLAATSTTSVSQTTFTILLPSPTTGHRRFCCRGANKIHTTDLSDTTRTIKVVLEAQILRYCHVEDGMARTCAIKRIRDSFKSMTKDRLWIARPDSSTSIQRCNCLFRDATFLVGCRGPFRTGPIGQ